MIPKQNSGLKRCSLCGKKEILTFEHIPPQCAFNNKPILVQGHEELVNEKSYLFGKKKRSQRGFGKQSLCSSCNNSTGNWYVKDFCNFTEQGIEILKTKNRLGIVTGNYTIKPQNVIKQILLMFAATDSMRAIGNFPGVREYLLNKENVNFPDKINIYLYSNASQNKRMIGYCVVGAIDSGRVNKWAEINYQPFGYFFTYDSPPPNDFMVNISDFAKVPYDKEYNMKLTTAYLDVNNFIIGTYTNT